MSRVLKLSILLSILVILSLSLVAQESEKKPEYTYKGANWCKMCHRQDNIYSSWQETAHAGAFDVLPEAQRENEQCLSCHATAETARGKLLEGVQCEACHGPGSGYAKQTIMEDREKSIANGLILGDRETCIKCHTDDLPDAGGEPSHDKFAYELMKPKGVHVLGVYTKQADTADVIEAE